MKLLSSLALFLLLLVPGAQGAASGSGMKPIKFEEYDLPNGLHVILHENHSAPVVATYVLYHVGSKNERADRTGFAHFFEHLMFEGSENINRGQIDKLISSAGGNLNASTSFDVTDYKLNLPANQLKLALWIESERMMHGKVEKVGVETQRQVVKEERRLNVDNRPYGTLFETLASLVFQGTPYEWTPIGSFQYIDQATIEEFQEFYRTYYLPNNATLAIAGDFDSAEVKPLIEAYFAPIPRGKEITRPEFAWPNPAVKPGEKTVTQDNTPLPSSLIAWRAVSQTADDAYPLELLTNILAQGKSSRLYQRLVDQEQVAYEVSAWPFLLEDAGVVGALATGNRDTTLDRLDSLIREEIAKVREHGVTREEWQKALNQKEAEIGAAYGSMASRASNLATYHVLYGDTNLINTEIDRYLAVTQEDLQRVAKKYLTDEAAFVLHYPLPVAPSAPDSKNADTAPAP